MPPVAATDTVAVVANPTYGGGRLKRLLLGTDYRDLWTAPIHVPVLDLDRFAGGLEVVRSGGSLQTRSLRLLGADRREYSFRSLDKFPEVTRSPDLRDTPLGRLIEDQTSALLPGAALVVPPLLEAAGVLHATPQLAVLPDDPRLGRFRGEFAGMLGTIEEHPDEREGDQPGFAGSDRIIGSDRLQERILESSDERVDSRAFLTARLLDILINDWDRHWGQWRWAERERDGSRVWIPIPEDRDYAFADYDGWLASLARTAVPNILSFGEEYAGLQTLTFNSFPVDRRRLSERPREVWDSAASALQRRLTDSVISEAVGRLPPPYRARVGAELEHALRARRERLPAFARRWYEWLSTEVDVHATDEPEVARVDYREDGSVEVRLYSPGEDADPGEPVFRRRFLPGETDEVRIYLHGGGDRAVVRGGGPRGSIVVRLIGGEGDDVLVDSSRIRGGSRVSFHDAPGDSDRFVAQRGTRVDTLPFTPPAGRDLVTRQGYRDFGFTRGTTATLEYGGARGIVLGAGPTWTRYGFRSVPYASRISLLGRYAPTLNGASVELLADWRRPNSTRGASLRALASQIEAFHFFGYGNDTPAAAEPSRYLVEQSQLLLRPALDVHLPAAARISLGPLVKYSWRDPGAASPVLPGSYGSGGFGQLGGQAEAVLDLRDSPVMPRSGVAGRFGGSGYAAAWDVEEPFGEVYATLATYLTPPGRRAPTLALRAGSRQVWGRAPIHEAARIGGWQDLRGYPAGRFAGDAAIWGGAELRAFLTRATLLVRGDLGVLALGDAGRVYVRGESVGGWHTATGGGLYFLFHLQGRPFLSSAIYARGEQARFRVQLGLPF